jgi:hypothetical protein
MVPAAARQQQERQQQQQQLGGQLTPVHRPTMAGANGSDCLLLEDAYRFLPWPQCSMSAEVMQRLVQPQGKLLQCRLDLGVAGGPLLADAPT